VIGLLSHLSFKLASLFLFNLLHTFQEELLDVRSLIKDHLAYSLEVAKLPVLEPGRLL